MHLLGPYEVNLDNDVKKFDGFQAVEDFTTPLFAADNLFNGLHTVSITNRRDTSDARPFLDIDFVRSCIIAVRSWRCV